MDVVKKLPPGAPGTKRYTAQYGERLVCVRYRHDKSARRRVTTIELIVDEAPLSDPPSPAARAIQPHPNRHVLVRVAYHEESLRRASRKPEESGCRKGVYGNFRTATWRRSVCTVESSVTRFPSLDTCPDMESAVHFWQFLSSNGQSI